MNKIFYNLTVDTTGHTTMSLTYSQLFNSLFSTEPYPSTLDFSTPLPSMPVPQTSPMAIMASLQDQLISIFLIVGVFFLILTLTVLEITKNMNLPSWFKIESDIDRNVIKFKILQSLAWVSFPLALFLVLLMLSVKYGWNL